MRHYLTMMTIYLCALGFSTCAEGAPIVNYYAPTSEYTSIKSLEIFHLQQALKKIKEDKFNYAWNEFAYVLHYIPNHPVALQLLGTLSLEMRREQRAKQYFQRALQLFPQDAGTHVLYGKFLDLTGEPEKALNQLQQAIVLEKNVPEYYYQLGLVYYRLKKYEQANQFAQAAYQQGFENSFLKEQLIAVQAWKEAQKA